MRVLKHLVLATVLAACGTPTTPDASPPPADASPAAQRVQVTELRARAQPPGAPNSAVFLTLTNEGEATALTGAAGDVAKSVELHTHAPGPDGAMQMRRVDEIALPAGEAVVLQPGSLHIMLIGLNRSLEEGGSVDLDLTFADGSHSTVTAPVKAIEAAGMHARAHGGHGMHAARHGATEGGTCACGKPKGSCGMHAAQAAADDEATCACGKPKGSCGMHAAQAASSADDVEATCACGKPAGSCSCGMHDAKEAPADDAEATCACGMPAGSCTCGGHGDGAH